jgi:hypothetical protein
VLAVNDIAAHSFYRHQVRDVLDVLDGPISWLEDLPTRLDPFVSSSFSSAITSDVCESVIAIFARYYMCRLQVLAAQQWFTDIPPQVGFNDDELREVTVYLSDDLSRFFPSAWRELERNGPDDPESIFQLLAAAKFLAQEHELDSPQLREYLMPREDLVERIVAELRATSSNIMDFVTMHLERRHAAWWHDFRADYKDTFKQWYFAGAFVGGQREPNSVLWPAIQERQKRREWLIRLGAGW